MFMRLETKANNRSHGDAFFVSASPPLQSRACCGRYVLRGKNAERTTS